MNSDTIDADLTPEQRRDLQLGEWIVEQRRRHRIELVVAFAFGACAGPLLLLLLRWF